ncbi:chromatin assembly factor 1 subunit A-like [Temnothorax curvispinosus]|uniref:Chromatin assembly factor 1 subunit A-like n=1 Tax=Temnothorax curvispinosus TaxID=300111 RepID=A0A6J1RGQ9_9HYME|nr:chromatin assembly factor 1 subunit A-like [Temnothorax curvispinosus]
MKERLRRLKEKVEGRKEEKGEERSERVEVERRLERKEKEERRRNIVIRGLEIRGGGRKEEAEKLLEKIRAKVKAIEVKRIGGDAEKGREMVLLKLENEEQKWEVEKKKLEVEKLRIEK